MTSTTAAPPAALATARPRRGLGDRLNPILVKEVRQALRGRYFRGLFTATLVFATFAGLLVVSVAAADRQLESIGVVFFMAMFACMSAAVHAFTPFWAYLSTSGEWDENTHDLLVLSNLRPRQIVAGKLLSALVQALLYYSTFGPFLVFAFLLNGVDLLSVTVILGCSFVACTALSLVGIALASLARTRAARGLLMAIFGAGLGILWGMSLTLAGAVVRSPQVLRGTDGRIGVLSFLTVAAVIGGLFAAVALARFSHEEENRSSPLRLLTLAIVLLAGGWSAALVRAVGSAEPAWGVQVFAAVLLLVPWLGFMTEPEALGRRARKHVTPRRWLAALSIPFLPGGGRAVLLMLLHFVVAFACTRVAVALGSGASPWYGADEALAQLAVFYGYAFTFIGLPTAIGSRIVRTPRGRMVLRMVVLVGVPILVLGPALFGLLLGIHSWLELEHPLNPVWVMMELDRSHPSSSAFWVALIGVAAAALVTLAVNVPRVSAGVREVLAASAANRAAARRSAGDAASVG